MKKTLLQKISNILFYIIFIFSWYIVSICTFSRWEECSTLLNFILYALLFLTGFFHHIAYKYNSFKTLSNVILALYGIISVVFAVLNSDSLERSNWYVSDIFNFFLVAFAFALLLLFHLVSSGKFDGEIRIHEFNVKMEDGRYEKVTVKEKIPDTTNQIDTKTVIKKLLKTILILFLVFVICIFGFIIFLMVDDGDFKEEVTSLPTELVSKEYYDEFNAGDYIRLEWDSLTIEKEQCYYNNDGEYIVVSEPTRMISESGKATESTYWQMGDNKNFIMNLVDEDFGNYTRAYYINKNCVYPDETAQIIKIVTQYDEELNFSEKQIEYIKNSVKNFDSDLTEKDKVDWIDEYGYLDDYGLVFCFEGFDDIRLTCCSIVKDKSGQWYLYKDYNKSYYNEKVIFYDLEKLPQDICDTINESLK